MKSRAGRRSSNLSPQVLQIPQPPLLSQEDTNDVEVQSILALCYSHNQLGVAGYRELYNTIYGDVVEVGLEDIESVILSMKLTFEPTLFLIHPGILTNHSLLKAILEGIDGRPNTYNYKTLRTSAWNEKYTAHIIYNDLKIRARTENLGTVAESVLDTIRRLEIDLDIEKLRLKQSLGALLTYLQDHIFTLEQGRISVSAIERFPNISYLRLDDNSYQALQIFDEDYHPNWISNYGKSKEGFSLFGLYDRTSSLLGRQKLREWMSKPFCDLEKISERHQGIRFTLNPVNSEILSQFKFNLRHIGDIPKLVLRIKKVVAKPKDWCKLYISLTNSITILEKLEVHQNFLSGHHEDAQFLEKLLFGLNSSVLRNLVKLLSAIVNFEQTLESNTIYINEGIDSVLDEKREAYSNLEQILHDAGQVTLQESPFLQKFNVEYVPQVGYLLVIDNALLPPLQRIGIIRNYEDMHSGKIIAEPLTPFSDQQTNQLIWIYSHAEKSYFKNRVTLDLDRCYGDLKTDISIRQKSIMIDLEEKILDFEIELLQLSMMIATLDVFMSLGEISWQNKLVCPQLTENNVLVIKSGRHILQELTVDTFVPNDTYMTGEKCLSIITGPNGSGKSVYLKQIGLIVYMAHIGSFVPCEKAIIGLVDQMFTRIFTEESATDYHSSFTSDVTQVSRMLNHSTKRSLCLLDEFGKGTEPLDGMSLLAAVMKQFAESNVKAIFSIHYTEVIRARILPNHILQSINCFRMETITESNEVDISNEVRVIPLFKLKYGVEQEAYGLECAEAMGVLPVVIKRAREIKFCLNSNLSIETFTLTAPKLAGISFTQEERATLEKMIMDQMNQKVVKRTHDQLDISDFNFEF